MGVKSNEELKREQYLAEFSRVVTNFKWNASRIYFGDIIAIKLCFKEALKQIDILHEKELFYVEMKLVHFTTGLKEI